MAQLQMAEMPLHCGFSIEEGSAILSDHEHRLSQSNIVSIDIGWKEVSACCDMLLYSFFVECHNNAQLFIPYM